MRYHFNNHGTDACSSKFPYFFSNIYAHSYSYVQGLLTCESCIDAIVVGGLCQWNKDILGAIENPACEVALGCDFDECIDSNTENAADECALAGCGTFTDCKLCVDHSYNVAGDKCRWDGRCYSATAAANAADSVRCSSESDCPVAIDVDECDILALQNGSMNLLDPMTVTAIAGGSGGGVAALLLATILIVCFIRRSKKRKEQQKHGDHDNEELKSLDNDEENQYDTAPASLNKKDATAASDDDDKEAKKETKDNNNKSNVDADDNEYIEPPSSDSVIPKSSSSGKKKKRKKQQHQQHQDKFHIPANELTKLNPIGEGSFGTVFKGKWRAITVAIKECKTLDPMQKKSLLDEAEGMKNLRPHENIVTFYGISDDPFSIVTEFCELGSLDDLLYHENADRRRQFTQEEKKQIALGSARGVSHLHAEGLIHRDLAARNILLNGQLVAKVADFGMARLAGADSDHGKDYTATRVGPIKWMSSEQLEKQQYSFKSDVYSLGVIFYELYAESLPWATQSNIEAAQTVVRGGHLEPPADCPQLVARLMLDCFEYDAADRPDAADVVGRLEALDWDHVDPVDRTAAGDLLDNQSDDFLVGLIDDEDEGLQRFIDALPLTAAKRKQAMNRLQAEGVADLDEALGMGVDELKAAGMNVGVANVVVKGLKRIRKAMFDRDNNETTVEVSNNNLDINNNYDRPAASSPVIDDSSSNTYDRPAAAGPASSSTTTNDYDRPAASSSLTPGNEYDEPMASSSSPAAAVNEYDRPAASSPGDQGDDDDDSVDSPNTYDRPPARPDESTTAADDNTGDTKSVEEEEGTVAQESRQRARSVSSPRRRKHKKPSKATTPRN